MNTFRFSPVPLPFDDGNPVSPEQWAELCGLLSPLYAAAETPPPEGGGVPPYNTWDLIDGY